MRANSGSPSLFGRGLCFSLVDVLHDLFGPIPMFLGGFASVAERGHQIARRMSFEHLQLIDHGHVCAELHSDVAGIEFTTFLAAEFPLRTGLTFVSDFTSDLEKTVGRRLAVATKRGACRVCCRTRTFTRGGSSGRCRGARAFRSDIGPLPVGR